MTHDDRQRTPPRWLRLIGAFAPIGAWIGFVLFSRNGCWSTDPNYVGFMGGCVSTSAVNLIYAALAVVAVGVGLGVYRLLSR